MNIQAPNSGRDCPSIEIASYIDGELSLEKELELELHFAGCNFCLEEMNQQKQFLCALDSALRNEAEIEMPSNFTKVVVTNAESRVNGLRRPTERLNALFICAALLFFVLFALGAEAGSAFKPVAAVFEQVIAVVGFVLSFAYDIAFGAVVILRPLGSRMAIGYFVSAILLVLFVFSLFGLSRLVLRHHRA